MRRIVLLSAARFIAALLVVAGVAAAGLAGATSATSATAVPQPIPGIRSPSGNIRCLFVPPARATVAANLLCTIGRASYSRLLQRRCGSAPAGLDWHGFELPATRTATLTCSGGILYDPATQRPAYTTLAYGHIWRHGPFTCTSRRTGITCTNRTGHGLFLSRESWRAW